MAVLGGHLTFAQETGYSFFWVAWNLDWPEVRCVPHRATHTQTEPNAMSQELLELTTAP